MTEPSLAELHTDGPDPEDDPYGWRYANQNEPEPNREEDE